MLGIDIRRVLRCVAAVCALIVGGLLQTEVQAAQATLSWNYTASGAAGFVVYCGTTSGAYPIRKDVGNTTSYTITGLASATTYYCVTTAYDPAKVESLYSGQIAFTTPPPPTTPPPTTPAPVAAFTASPTTGTAPVTVNFTNATTGSATSWLWTFGDGTTSTLEMPTHIYSAAGTFTVSLRATGPGGSSTRTAASYIRVSAPAAALKLVAAYGFEEGTGTRVLDASGYANAGTLTNTAWSTAGRFGKALTFNGNSFITINDAAALNLTNALTLEAWVYPTAALTRWTDILMKEKAGGASYYLTAGSPSGTPATGVGIGAEQILRGLSALPLNAWSHLAATYDGSAQRLYVNGVLVSSRPQAGSIDPAPGPLRIGGNSVWGEYFTGQIDEVRIYGRALSAAEILADMAKPVGVGR